MQVDIGCEQRTVVSECKYVMDVEDAVGKKVLFVANLPPTEINGIMSHGESHESIFILFPEFHYR
jgi:tRNA-binding EMAP/Myf-like protein